MEIVGIIPARYRSSRFPGKPLADLNGKPMVQHVFEAALRTVALNRVFVATDDVRIFDAVKAFGGEALMTAADHPSGTDRLAEAAQRLALSDDDIVVNIQGDEPLVKPGMIEVLVAALVRSKDCPMATLAFVSSSRSEFLNPNVVKVVMDLKGKALYFSRAPIPCWRDVEEDLQKVDAIPGASGGPFSRGGEGGAIGMGALSRPRGATFLKHLGYYAYRHSFLLAFTRLKPTPLETAEKLEQLRALENGYGIHVAISPHETIGVDTPEDFEEVSRRLKQAPP